MTAPSPALLRLRAAVRTYVAERHGPRAADARQAVRAAWLALTPAERVFTEWDSAERDTIQEAALGTRYWAPGMAFPPGGRGYTRAEAAAAVGAGWADLAGRAWDAVTAGGGRVIQVKEKFARLLVYWHMPDGRVRPPAIGAALVPLESESERTCEACGAPGRPRGRDDERERRELEELNGMRAVRYLTLCDACARRVYVDGERDWARIVVRTDRSADDLRDPRD